MMVRKQPYSSPKFIKLKKPQFEEVRERGELPGDLNEINPLSVRDLLNKMLSVSHESRPSSEECAAMVAQIRATLPPDQWSQSKNLFPYIYTVLISPFGRVVFRRLHQTSAFARAAIHCLDDIDHLLLVSQRPVDFVIITSA